MKTIHPYLYFNGVAEEALTFYRSVFGGEFLTMMRYREMPNPERVPESEQDWIMHAALPVGNVNLLASDFPQSMGRANFGNGVCLMIIPDSEEEARRLFDALSVGGTVDMPLEKQFWGDLYGMLTDKYGVQWMIDYAPAENE
jgi:PhnB protein